MVVEHGAATVIIGAGPAGLATAAALAKAGRPVTVLEKADRVGASWAARYDSLHLHTVRWLSALPGLPIPRGYGRWVARDDLVRYLSDYARVHGLHPARCRRYPHRPSGSRRLAGHTGAGVRAARRVVVATGYSHTRAARTGRVWTPSPVTCGTPPTTGSRPRMRAGTSSSSGPETPPPRSPWTCSASARP